MSSLLDPETLEPSIESARVHEWRAEQLHALGLPEPLAELFADEVDWHAVAALVRSGCSPWLALEIVR